MVVGGEMITFHCVAGIPNVAEKFPVTSLLLRVCFFVLIIATICSYVLSYFDSGRGG
jgi:hypothetical protein